MQADYGPLVEGINQLTGLDRLGLMLPALGDQQAGPLVDPARIIRLDLPELEQLTVDVKVGTVDARGCPKLWEVRRAQAPAVAVAEVRAWFAGNLDEASGPALGELWRMNAQLHPGPYEASPDDGILLARAGSWQYGEWIHGSWKYKGEHPGWLWFAENGA